MMNLPNKLTIIRVCLIPFFVVALLFDHGKMCIRDRRRSEDFWRILVMVSREA